MFSLKPVVKTYSVGRKNRTEIIKRRLKTAFDEHPGTTNKNVADHCGVSEQAVWKWRRTGVIQRDNIPVLASFFGQRPDWLLDDLSELREPGAVYETGLSRAETEILAAMRELPIELANEIRRHVAAIASACRKIKNRG